MARISELSVCAIKTSMQAQNIPKLSILESVNQVPMVKMTTIGVNAWWNAAALFEAIINPRNSKRVAFEWRLNSVGWSCQRPVGSLRQSDRLRANCHSIGL